MRCYDYRNLPPPTLLSSSLAPTAVSANLGASYVDELEKGTVSVEEISNIGFFFLGKQVGSVRGERRSLLA